MGIYLCGKFLQAYIREWTFFVENRNEIKCQTFTLLHQLVIDCALRELVTTVHWWFLMEKDKSKSGGSILCSKKPLLLAQDEWVLLSGRWEVWVVTLYGHMHLHKYAYTAYSGNNTDGGTYNRGLTQELLCWFSSTISLHIGCTHELDHYIFSTDLVICLFLATWINDEERLHHFLYVDVTLHLSHMWVH